MNGSGVSDSVVSPKRWRSGYDADARPGRHSLYVFDVTMPCGLRAKPKLVDWFTIVALPGDESDQSTNRSF
jgi:hypothetical protein